MNAVVDVAGNRTAVAARPRTATAELTAVWAAHSDDKVTRGRHGKIVQVCLSISFARRAHGRFLRLTYLGA